MSSVIGSGIFLTPGRIADLLPHPGLIFAAWTVGALISLVGALVNAELGAMFPRAGGDYVYLRAAFHPGAGFLIGWLTFFVIYAGTIATLAAGFASSLAGFLGYGSTGVMGIAIAVTVAVSALNYVGVRWGATANNVTGYFKVVALVSFAAVGPFFGDGSVENLTPVIEGIGKAAPLLAFGLALSPILFSFLGWNASVFVASEIRDPGRNVPRSLFLGLAICTGIYLIVNAVYLYAIPMADFRGVDNAGEAAAGALFGPISGKLVSAFVLASILGTLNATILVGPRIAYAMALDGLFFSGVERAHVSYNTPHVAIVVQGVVSLALLAIFEGFPDSLFVNVLNYTTIAIVLATIADTLALYALRRREPDLARPYRAWGYPWLPALYIGVNVAIAVALFWGAPRECSAVLAMAALGWPFYRYFARYAPARAT